MGNRAHPVPAAPAPDDDWHKAIAARAAVETAPAAPAPDAERLVARLRIWGGSGFTRDLLLGDQRLGDDATSAADLLAAQAREIAEARAERDALRKCVQLADAMLQVGTDNERIRAYKKARAAIDAARKGEP